MKSSFRKRKCITLFVILCLWSMCSCSNSAHIIALGETGSFGGLKITFLDFQVADKVGTGVIFGNEVYEYPDEGYQYAIVTLSVENNTKEDRVIVPASDFQFYADNVAQKYFSLQNASLMPKINTYNALIDESSNDEGIYGDTQRTIRAGRIIEGYIVCEIPIDTMKFEMEFAGFILEHSLS